MELKGKTAVVTGGARRLGRAMVLALAGRGVRVVVHYAQSGEPARETVAEAQRLGTEAIAVRADLSREEAIHQVIPTAVAHFGAVDILVNNAAIFEPGNFADTTSPAWDRHFMINLKAPFLLSQDFVAQVSPDRTAKIVNLGDWRGLRPGADHFAYTLTKSALIALTRSMALALAPNIQVNCLALGAIMPPDGAGEALRQKLIADIPVRRLGEPQDVVEALLFLLAGSDFITGETVVIDGGRQLV